jgi:hypothetical protein
MENEEAVQEQEVQEATNPVQDILRAAGMDESYEAEEPSIEPQAPVEEEVEQESVTPDAPDLDQDKQPEYYTIEELTELGKSESLDKINTSKIPPELQAVYKSLNAMATRRQQSLAEKEKELQARLEQAPQQKGTSPIPIEQKVYTDPVGAMRDIQQKLAETNHMLHAAQAQDDIFEVQKLLVEKDALKDKYLAVQGVISSANNEWESIFKAIPDFKEKAPKLKGFTQEVLGEDGFTEQEMNWLTNPLITGKISSKVVRLVNGLYELKAKYEGSLKTTEEKLKKTKPTPSLSPGSGDVSKVKNDTRSIRAKAMASGDIEDAAAYIAALTKKD